MLPFCKDAGFQGQMIGLEKNSTKEDGSVKWKVVNGDGSDHQHKFKQKGQVQAEGMKELAAAIREMAAAIGVDHFDQRDS